MKAMEGTTVVITGASRGIGREMALRFAKDGANVVLAAKTTTPHPKLQGTIHSVAQEVQALGGHALPVPVDVRFEDQIQTMVEHTIATFGSLDILINNAGAIFLKPAEQLSTKQFDLMQTINTRAVFVATKTALPHLKQSRNPHVLNICPPINMNPSWFKGFFPYTLSKYGMTLCTLGLAEELKPVGIAVNALWPKTIIATAAIDMLMGTQGRQKSRAPTIMADAAHVVVTSNATDITGQTFLDEEVLRAHGTTDFQIYAYDSKTPTCDLIPDLFVTPTD